MGENVIFTFWIYQENKTEEPQMNDILRSASTGDTDPLYYVAVMVVAVIIVAAVLIIGAKRRK